MSVSRVKNYRTDKYLKEFVDLNSLVKDSNNFYTITKKGKTKILNRKLLDDYIEQVADSTLNVTSKFVEKVKSLGGIYSDEEQKLGSLMNKLNAKVRDNNDISQKIKDKANFINDDEEELNKFLESEEEMTKPIGSVDLLKEMKKLSEPESVDLNETFMAEEQVPEQIEQTKESLEQELETSSQQIKHLVDFVMNMDINKRDEFSEKIRVLEERVRTLNKELENEYQGIGNLFELELASEINKLSVSVSALANQINAPNPDDPNISTDPKEPEPEQVASDTTITGPQKVKRYHPIPLGEFFGSIESDIDWDRELLQTILSSKMTAQEIIESSENVITEFGRKINVLKRKSDTIEEYNELRQMAFCVMRNLQRGSRSKTASMKVSDLVTLYSGGKYSQESPKQFGENKNFIPKINKVKLSPGDIYIKSESGPSLKYAPRTSRITTDNYL